MKIPQSVRTQIEKGPLAHLTTLNRDGSPQVTLIWVGIEDDEFVIGHLALHQKIKNIGRDPRVALSLIADGTSPQGMREYVVVYGNARITEGGAVPLLQRLAPLYIGPRRIFRRPRCAIFPATSRASRPSDFPESARGLRNPLSRRTSN